MSASALPITSARFAAALTDLTLSSLYLKAAELRNNIAHLKKSNAELEVFVREDNDRDCYEALQENREVVRRFEERIELIKKEVTEVRGLPWQPEEGEVNVELGEIPRSSVGAGARLEPTSARQNGMRNDRANGGLGAEEDEGVFL